MAEGDERLRTVLDAYANFVCEKKLAVPKHQPYLVRWVREFLLFARQHGGYTFQQTLDLFPADVGRRTRGSMTARASALSNRSGGSATMFPANLLIRP